MVEIKSYDRYTSDYEDLDRKLLEQATREQDLDYYIKLRQLVLLEEIRKALEE